jgi:hypothetical protein
MRFIVRLGYEHNIICEYHSSVPVCSRRIVPPAWAVMLERTCFVDKRTFFAMTLLSLGWMMILLLNFLVRG